MENIAIKINVNVNTYKIIKDIQKNLREKEGKKTSLAEIMLRLAQKGIQSIQNEHEYEKNVQNKDSFAQNKEYFAQNNTVFVQNKEDFAQNNTDFVQNSKRFIPKPEGKNLIITSKESKFIDELSIRQEYLSEREAEIRELEAELYDERDEIITKKRELLKLEEELLKKQYRNKYNSIENEVIGKVNFHSEKVYSFSEDNPYKTANNDITTELSKHIDTYFAKVFEKFFNIEEKLNDINRQTKHESSIKHLEQLHENDKKIIRLIEKGNQKTTLEKLEPLLPAALTTIVSFVMKNKQNNNFKELLKEIKALTGNEAGNNKTEDTEEKSKIVSKN